MRRQRLAIDIILIHLRMECRLLRADGVELWFMSTCLVEGIERRSLLSEPDRLFGNFDKSVLIDMHHLMSVPWMFWPETFLVRFSSADVDDR